MVRDNLRCGDFGKAINIAFAGRAGASRNVQQQTADASTRTRFGVARLLKRERSRARVSRRCPRTMNPRALSRILPAAFPPPANDCCVVCAAINASAGVIITSWNRRLYCVCCGPPAANSTPSKYGTTLRSRAREPRFVTVISKAQRVGSDGSVMRKPSGFVDRLVRTRTDSFCSTWRRRDSAGNCR